MRGFPSPRLRSSLSKKLAAKDSIASAPIGKSPSDYSKKSQLFRVSKASGTIPESKSLFFDKTHQKSLTLIDPDRICSILSQKDWFLTLNSEFKPIAVHLGSQSVICSEGFGRVELLWRKGPVVLSVELVNEIRSSGCGITEDLLCILMCSWGRLGLGKYANEVFGQMPYLGLKPTTRIYNAVIDAMVKANSLDLAYLKFQQMPSDNCTPDRFTYNILIHGVCRSGVVEEALRLLKQMESMGQRPNVFTYTILVDGFCNARKVDEAFGVLEMMARRNVAPSEATYRSLIHGSFECLGSSKAYEMLSRLLEQMTVCQEHACSTLLHCLSKDGMAREAINFISRMGAKGYLPDTTVFGVVMASAVRSLGWTEVCELMDDFIRRGGRPGFNTYLTIITYLLKGRKLAEADRFVKRMVLDGLVCSVVGNVNMAKDVLKMLLEHGFKPDVFTFSSIIDGLCRVYQMDDAFDCFSEMVEWGVSPNAVTYNILIHSLCIVGDVRKSINLLKTMREAGIDPDVYSFNALILNFCKMKKMDKAQNLFDSMLRLGVVPDRYTYNAIIKAFCDAHKIEEAKETVQTMEANDCAPNLYSYGVIIDALSSMGHFGEAQELLSECERKGMSTESLPAIKMGPEIEEKVVNH
ncbi:hypothetical protein J5N97_018367 [Dioscorea zingiberensis]|uniref:Pentatricopeptide repeat-containing protein n=1 Tax=Dioscorea zingiberensis TaxID=325984 RepID=A0A9D5CNV0_9LILI|nr:hypothetical protein J5N97_018367 [Dioscorea zingiberensis]